MKKWILLFFITVVSAEQPTDKQIAYNGLMQALDYLTTVNALSQEGFQEMNPVMRPVTENKVLFLAIKMAVLWSSSKMSKKQLTWFNRFYTAIIINNLTQTMRGNYE